MREEIITRKTGSGCFLRPSVVWDDESSDEEEESELKK